ncbi:methylated-DNA-[protein]-cysteine S-methyltransferase [Lentibacillus halodurans]|uniref:Methylated-DNA--protein-cysteine methyltransferase n=1 Tax=Lentibacillus halodurans TaxID=237679 RepID=A0A1I0VX99_9BACI|nr:methylated-DNA--[protein]-cysteine S-methyltransferase [Lentibacillus halodurans]SFA80513.1 methylated-DNA-[protein]-cysteine S-methyltransferase [Lentibacillus halodurans]
MELYYSEMDSPVGTLTIVSNGEKVIRIDYGSFADLEATMTKWASHFFDKPVFIPKPEKVHHVITELRDYFQGKRQNFSFDFEYYGTPFQQKVWKALHDTIPYGQTRTYKDIAGTIKQPKAVRAVGGAVNKNPFSIVVPCHRVIGANGKMIGYGGGLDKKEFLLTHEAK